MNDVCVVMLCNKAYFDKFIQTYGDLRTKGCYTGPVCLVIGDDLLGHPGLSTLEGNLTIKHFPDIAFTDTFIEVQHDIPRERHWFRKRFQYHKFYLFHPYFKQWNYVFYIDCGVLIFRDISPILDERKPSILLAHSNGYPTYTIQLNAEFSTDTEHYERLDKAYNLHIDSFQTTIMLYDTGIITATTVEKLISLAEEYPISITNDQGIIGLYFSAIHPQWEQLKIKNDDTHFYDYGPRGTLNDVYIMTKLWY